MGKATDIIDEVKKVICGKDDVITMVLTGMLSNGHILIEDVPGVGKTTMALSFSRVMGLDYGRVQFTPDVLPSDITGFSIFDKEKGTMVYQQGAVFHNLFLADELNRASSRTQSALLEAMEERQVTVDGNTYQLPNPFVVFATQNPSGASGTSLLPDSQMDRFTIKISMGYPSMKDEMEMVKTRKSGNPIESLEQVISSKEFLEMQKEVTEVHMDDKVLKYIVALVGQTRASELLERGASPRATLDLANMSKAHAYVSGKSFVTPNDVKAVFDSTITHRVLLSPNAEMDGVSASEAIEEVIKFVAAPRV
ncbi:MAG: MoxR family ATPase [Clostridia bacterium]|nr:MoxR family ATPase [Clostridia bacterium]